MVSASDAEPHNPDPATPTNKASTATTTSVQVLKSEPFDQVVSSPNQVTFDPDPEPTISSDTLHALVEQLRPAASANVQQIVIIRVGEEQPSPAQQ